MQLVDTKTAPPCIHCGHLYSEHKRRPAPADVAVYVPCTKCDCTGWSDDDPWLRGTADEEASVGCGHCCLVPTVGPQHCWCECHDEPSGVQ